MNKLKCTVFLPVEILFTSNENDVNQKILSSEEELSNELRKVLGTIDKNIYLKDKFYFDLHSDKIGECGNFIILLDK